MKVTPFVAASRQGAVTALLHLVGQTFLSAGLAAFQPPGSSLRTGKSANRQAGKPALHPNHKLGVGQACPVKLLTTDADRGNLVRGIKQTRNLTLPFP